MAAVEASPGRRIHYDLTGPDHAPVVVLIAGWGAPRRSWAPTAIALGRELRVLTFDNRDVGENEPETTSYVMADMADDVAQLLGVLDVGTAHVVGHSLGGMIALHVALRHPDVIDRLVLVGTLPASWAALGMEISMPAFDIVGDPVAAQEQALAWMCAPGYYDDRETQLRTDAEHWRGNRVTLDGLGRQLSDIPAYDVRGGLGDIAAPTLIIHGDRDPVTPLAGAVLMSQLLPDARLLVYPGVGHVPMFEATDRFHDDLRTFLGDDEQEQPPGLGTSPIDRPARAVPRRPVE